MQRYSGQKRVLVAVDCIVFGFDGRDMKLLLVQRAIEPEKNKWSLMGGFIASHETPDQAATRVLEMLTGLKKVYLQQLHVFGRPDRDPVERTFSIAYSALIDINKYERQLNEEYHAEWFPINEAPSLIFDHDDMVRYAKTQLKYKAALHPVLFKLLPEKFTIPQLQALYEGVYQAEFDDRNFSRKLLSTGLLVKLDEKDKNSSKKGAFYYKLNETEFSQNFNSFLNFVPNPDKFLIYD